MMRGAVASIAVAGVLVACGGATSNAPTTSPPPPAKIEILPVIDMRFVAVDETTTKVALVLHADGTLDRPGKQGARITEGRVVCADGSELLRIDDKDDVVFDEKIVAHLTADGAFAMDRHYGNWSMTVRDDGDVEMTTKIEGTISSHDVRWEGFRPAARRTASLLSGFLTPAFGGVWCGEPLPKMR